MITSPATACSASQAANSSPRPAPAAHGPAQIRVAAADVTGAVLVVRDDEVRNLDGHGGVVQHDGENGDPAAHSRLEVETGHAEGGVAHEIDAELVGRGELGADG